MDRELTLLINNIDAGVIVTFGKRPTRAAAAKGDAQRLETTAQYKALDAMLQKSMGTSDGFYSITKSGSDRQEYHC